MKKLSNVILAGFTAGWFGAATLALAQPPPPGDLAPPPPPPVGADAAPAPDQPPGADASGATTVTITPLGGGRAAVGAEGTNSSATAGMATNGVLVNIHGLGVDAALKYLASKAGLIIIRQANTGLVQGTVDLETEKPLSTTDMVSLINKILANNDLVAVLDGNTLTVETTEAALTSSGTPINVWHGDYQTIPQDSVVGTYVIQLHSLNPVEVLKDLLTLRPEGAQMNSSAGGNAIIMTARNSDVRHFAQIIEALDSSGNGDLEVFLLTYADSKSIAQELKDVFSPTDNANGPNGAQQGIAAIFGRGRGGGGGGGGGAGGAADDPKRAAIHVNAVSDDQNNAVLVSAPIDIMPGISNLIVKLDIPQDDTVEIKVFALQHADPTDVVNELDALFPDPTMAGNQQNGNARGQQARFGGAGGGGGGGAAAAGAGGLSDRMKKQITVNSVADARTQSVLVTASKDTMVEIEKMIAEMDANPARQMHVYAFKPVHGDVTDMQQPLQDLFGSTTSRSSTTTTSALTQRQTTAAQNGGTLNSSSLSSSGLGGGGGAGGTTGGR